MDMLSGIPTPHGIDLLKQELYDKITQFALVNTDGAVYYTGDVHSLSFDQNGVLTVVFVIPKEENLQDWNDRVQILDDQGEPIVEYQTPQIQFVQGVGGEQTAKIPVSGSAGEIVFKADEYMTMDEARRWVMRPVIENTAHLLALETALINKGILLEEV